MAHAGNKGELACIYAALILADDDVAITADKLNAILKAAKVNFVEPYLPGLFAGSLRGRNIKELLTNIGAGASGGAAPAAAPAAGAAPAEAAAAPAAEDKGGKKGKKEEPESESDEDMGFDLFG